VQAAIPTNTKMMFHHRTTTAVMEGTQVMGGDLAERVGKRHVLAVLGFECGARTSPFLGLKGTNEENIALQAAIAPDAPWLGMLAWGEIAPVGGEPAFHNYTYPLVVLTAG
jgi:small ligand-binding sensory domain FIST